MTARFVALAALLLSILLPAGSLTAASPDPLPDSEVRAPHVPGQVLVKFTSSAAARGLRTSVDLRGRTLMGDLPEPGWAQVKLAAGEDVASALASLVDDPDVEYAQPNYVYQARKAPNDPLYGQMWGLKNTSQIITNTNTQPPGSDAPYSTNNPPATPGTPGKDVNVEKAWDTRTDCSSVLVAVIDTGINYNHVDLKGNMWKGPAEIPNSGWNFVGSVAGTNDPMDLDGHGTHVAGTIGAVGNNDVGVTGVCWTASIMAVKVIGPGGADTAAIIRGIDFAIKYGAKVINMSLGQHNAKPNPLYAAAMDRALKADVAVLVAAGNDGLDNDAALDLPCNYSKDFKNVVCVAGLDQKYDMYSDSNYGKTTVALGAPATNILSTWAGTSNKDASFSGEWTSTTTTTGGGWVLSKCGTAPNQFDCLVDPSTYPIGTYNKGTDDRAYNVISVPRATSAVLTVRCEGDLGPGDTFNVFSKAGLAKTDPFGGTPIYEESGLFPLDNAGMDVTACQGTNCSIGFQLKSVTTGAAAKGVKIESVTVSSLVSDNVSYGKSNGTSMATPMVAGVVALLRAYNPLYKWEDVVTNIKRSGPDVPSLAGKTETGKAIDAMRALAFILPPTGLTAKVE